MKHTTSSTRPHSFPYFLHGGETSLVWTVSPKYLNSHLTGVTSYWLALLLAFIERDQNFCFVQPHLLCPKYQLEPCRCSINVHYLNKDIERTCIITDYTNKTFKLVSGFAPISDSFLGVLRLLQYYYRKLQTSLTGTTMDINIWSIKVALSSISCCILILLRSHYPPKMSVLW